MYSFFNIQSSLIVEVSEIDFILWNMYDTVIIHKGDILYLLVPFLVLFH